MKWTTTKRNAVRSILIASWSLAEHTQERKTQLGNHCAMKKKFNRTELQPHLMVECFCPEHPFFTRFFQERAEPSLSCSFHARDGFSSLELIETGAKKHPKLPIILGHLREGENAHAETLGTIPGFIGMPMDIYPDLVLFSSDAPTIATLRNGIV